MLAAHSFSGIQSYLSKADIRQRLCCSLFGSSEKFSPDFCISTSGSPAVVGYQMESTFSVLLIYYYYYYFLIDFILPPTVFFSVPFLTNCHSVCEALSCLYVVAYIPCFVLFEGNSVGRSGKHAIQTQLDMHKREHDRFTWLGACLCCVWIYYYFFKQISFFV